MCPKAETLKKPCTSCGKEIPQTSSICVFCGKRQTPVQSPSTTEDPAKSTYQGVAVASDADPATVRRVSLAAFTPTHEPNPAGKKTSFHVRDNEQTLDGENEGDEPVMTLPMTPAVQRPGTNLPPTSPAGKPYSTLPMTPAVQRPLADPSSSPSGNRPASSSSGMFSRPQPTPSQIETGGGTMLGLSVVRAPSSAQSKVGPPGANETMVGNATQGAKRATLPPPAPPGFVPESSQEETRLPEAASTMLGVPGPKLQAPPHPAEAPQGSSTLFGRPAPSKEVIAQQLRAMDVVPGPDPGDSLPAVGLPVPPGARAVALMNHPVGVTTDVVPMFDESAETSPDRIAPSLESLSAPKEEPKIPGPALSGERRVGVLSGPHLSVSASQKQEGSATLAEVGVPEAIKASRAKKEATATIAEPLPAVPKKDPISVKQPAVPAPFSEHPLENPALVPLDAPIPKDGWSGTAQLVKAAKEAAVQAPPDKEEPFPGARLARWVGPVAGVFLIVAALLPVGAKMQSAWQILQQGGPALLLAVWGIVGVLAIVGGVFPLKPGQRGLFYLAIALPALVLGALWGISFFTDLLAPAIEEAARGVAPALRPKQVDTGFLENLDALTPPWRVGLVIFAWTFLPAALFYRRFDTASIPARLMVTAGSAVVFANYLIPFESGFVVALLSPLVGSPDVAQQIVGEGPVAISGLLLHLLSTGEFVYTIFGVILALPAVLALLSFTAFFPGEQVSRDQNGNLLIHTPVLSTGATGLWASLFLLYLPVPMVVLGAILCLDPAQRASGLVFIRCGLVAGTFPLLFSIGFGQAAASLTYRRVT